MPEILPPSAVERAVTQIWSELLGEPVSSDDDFFRLGGTSLSAVQMMEAVRNHFAISLHIRSLLRSPVLADFAAQVEEQVSAAAAVSVPNPAEAGSL